MVGAQEPAAVAAKEDGGEEWWREVNEDSRDRATLSSKH